MLLGGRSAEEIAFGEISTGAQNDLQRATDIARSMVTEFGMSDALGAVNYDGHRGSTFLDTPFMNERGNHSEDTAQKIDAEVKRILTDAHDDGAPRPARAPRHPRRAVDAGCSTRKSSKATSSARCSDPSRRRTPTGPSRPFCPTSFPP